ncbi:MAG: hypothetical protein LH606_15400 [Cytophagaceae bacterium]|nr:hypothetical protein [Cytophagaceae bacterium]
MSEEKSHLTVGWKLVLAKLREDETVHPVVKNLNISRPHALALYFRVENGEYPPLEGQKKHLINLYREQNGIRDSNFYQRHYLIVENDRKRLDRVHFKLSPNVVSLGYD